MVFLWAIFCPGYADESEILLLGCHIDFFRGDVLANEGP